MKSYPSIVLIFLLGTTSSPVPAQGVVHLTEFRSCNCSDFMFSTRTADGFSKDEIGKSRQAVSGVTPDQVNAALADYENTRKKSESEASYLRIAEAGYNSGSATVNFAAPDMPLNLVNLSYQVATEEAIRKQEARIIAERERLTNSLVADLLKHNPDALNAARSGDPAKAHTILFGQDAPARIIAEAGLDSLLDHNSITKQANALSLVTAEDLVSLASNVDEFASGLNAALEEYDELNSEMTSFTTAITGEIDAVGKALGGLQAAYDVITSNGYENTFSMDRLESIMTSRMSPAEKFENLRSGIFKPYLTKLNKEQQKAFAEGIEKAANIEIWRGHADDFVGGASGILNIAKNAGIDVANAQNYVNKGQAIFSGVLSIYAGGPMGYIGGISSISNVLGGGSEGNQNAAVLAELKALSEQMKKYHEEQMKTLKEIEAKVEEGFMRSEFLQVETLHLLQGISDDIKEVLVKGLSFCGKIMETPSHQPIIKVSRDDFQHENFNSCRTALSDIFRVQDDNHYDLSGAFKRSSTSINDDKQSTSSYLTKREILTPMLKYSNEMIKRRYPDCTQANRQGLLMRVLAVDPRGEGAVRAALPEELDCSSFTPLTISTRDDLSFSIEAIGEPIAFEALARALVYAAGILPVYERFVTPGGENSKMLEFSDQTQLNEIGLDRSGQNRIAYTRDEIAHAYASGLIALAQINLIAGDLLMEQLEADLMAGLKADPESMKIDDEPFTKLWVDCVGDDSVASRYFGALCVLERNTILKSNFSRYLTRKHMKAGAMTAIARYQIAHANYRKGIVLLSGIVDTFNQEVGLKDAGTTPKNAAYLFPIFGREPYVHLGAEAGEKYKGKFGLYGDVMVPLPEWFEVASDRIFFGAPGAVEVIQETRRLSEMLRSYDMTLKTPAAVRGLSQEAAVAAAELTD